MKEATTAPLPTSLTNQLEEDGIALAEWEAMTDEERQERGLTVEEHEDVYADYSAEEMAAVEAWLLDPGPRYHAAVARIRAHPGW
jgi:hypothetical protein